MNERLNCSLHECKAHKGTKKCIKKQNLLCLKSQATFNINILHKLINFALYT